MSLQDILMVYNQPQVRGSVKLEFLKDSLSLPHFNSQERLVIKELIHSLEKGKNLTPPPTTEYR